MTDDSKKGFKLLALVNALFLGVFITAAGIWLVLQVLDSTGKAQITQSPSEKPELSFSEDFINAVIEFDEPEKVVYKDTFRTDSDAGYKSLLPGKRINIAITGVDSRLGSRYKHADANHILSILPEQGKIEIISIPRDTEADAGLPDTSDQNKLAVVRAVKGRTAYLDELAKIAGVSRINYYIEFGFSQAMGILEFLGYENSANTLRVLRARKGIATSDYQRHYNQAQFIRQAISRRIDDLDGFWGDIFIRGGLAMVETNLSAEASKSIISKLKANGFLGKEDITIRIRPAIKIRFKVYDFSDPEFIEFLTDKLESKKTTKIDTIKKPVQAEVILNAALEKAYKDTSRSPKYVISGLGTLYNQRAWLQVSDKTKRDRIRNEIGYLLSEAYIRKKDTASARLINSVIASEKKLFNSVEKKRGINKPDTSADIIAGY